MHITALLLKNNTKEQETCSSPEWFKNVVFGKENAFPQEERSLDFCLTRSMFNRVVPAERFVFVEEHLVSDDMKSDWFRLSIKRKFKQVV